MKTRLLCAILLYKSGGYSTRPITMYPSHLLRSLDCLFGDAPPDLWEAKKKRRVVELTWISPLSRKHFDMDISIGYGSIKKFVRRVSAIPKLSLRDTYFDNVICCHIVTMDRPYYYGNQWDVAIATMERPCGYVNHRDTLMMSLVAIVTMGRSCYYGSCRGDLIRSFVSVVGNYEEPSLSWQS